jgi:hypothetical protein
MRLFQNIEGSEVIYINTYAATTPRLNVFKQICSSNSKEPELIEIDETKHCHLSDHNKYTYNSDSSISMNNEETSSDDDWKDELDQYFARNSV